MPDGMGEEDARNIEEMPAKGREGRQIGNTDNSEKDIGNSHMEQWNKVIGRKILMKDQMDQSPRQARGSL
jgi:hypothetical protein